MLVGTEKISRPQEIEEMKNEYLTKVGKLPAKQIPRTADNV